MAEKTYANAPPLPSYTGHEGYAPVQPPPPYYAGAYEQPKMTPQHQQQYQQPMQQQPLHQQTVMQHVYAVAPAVGPDPSSLQCPSCRQMITTRLDYETTTKTHIMAALLCCFICWPCAWVPYVMDSCKNANHYCPNCSAYIGTYKS